MDGWKDRKKKWIEKQRTERKEKGLERKELHGSDAKARKIGQAINQRKLKGRKRKE